MKNLIVLYILLTLLIPCTLFADMVSIQTTQHTRVVNSKQVKYYTVVIVQKEGDKEIKIVYTDMDENIQCKEGCMDETYNLSCVYNKCASN